MTNQVDKKTMEELTKRHNLLRAGDANRFAPTRRASYCNHCHLTIGDGGCYCTPIEEDDAIYLDESYEQAVRDIEAHDAKAIAKHNALIESGKNS